MAITPAQVFTRQYWVNLVTLGAGTFATSFLGYVAATTHTPTIASVEAAAWASLVTAAGVTLHSTGVTAAARAKASPPTL